jgi:hypothetical protein
MYQTLRRRGLFDWNSALSLLCAKKPMLFLASMGEMGLSHDIFFKFSLGPFEVVEVKWRSMLNFEAATSKFCNYSWKFGSSPRKGKVDLCMINGSKVLIYLTLLYFLLHYLQEYSKMWNIAKSNKSELWNRCHTEVYLTFSRWGAKLSETIAKFRGRSLKIQHRLSFALNDLERPKWELKKNVMG